MEALPGSQPTYNNELCVRKNGIVPEGNLSCEYYRKKRNTANFNLNWKYHKEALKPRDRNKARA